MIADVTLSAHDRLKSALNSNLAQPAAPGAPVDAGWSRIRRMHAFAQFLHCSPELAVSKSPMFSWPTTGSKGLHWPDAWETLSVSPVRGKSGVALRARDLVGPECTSKSFQTKRSVDQLLNVSRSDWYLYFVRRARRRQLARSSAWAGRR
jgi:hypothetical protein